MRTVSADWDRLAEGARWVAGRLVFVDILDGRLYEVVDGQTRLLGFSDLVDGAFVGEILDPVPLVLDP